MVGEGTPIFGTYPLRPRPSKSSSARYRPKTGGIVANKPLRITSDQQQSERGSHRAPYSRLQALHRHPIEKRHSACSARQTDNLAQKRFGWREVPSRNWKQKNSRNTRVLSLKNDAEWENAQIKPDRESVRLTPILRYSLPLNPPFQRPLISPILSPNHEPRTEDNPPGRILPSRSEK